MITIMVVFIHSCVRGSCLLISSVLLRSYISFSVRLNVCLISPAFVRSVDTFFFVLVMVKEHARLAGPSYICAIKGCHRI